MTTPQPGGERPRPGLRILQTGELKFSPGQKRWTVIILAGLVTAFVLRVGEVLAPFVWAAVTAFVFNGLINWLIRRFNLPRWVWTGLIYLAFFVILVAGLALLIPAIGREARVLSSDVPVIQQDFNNYLAANPNITLAGIDIPSETVRNAVDGVLDRLPGLAEELGPRLLSRTLRFLIDFLLYLVATFYLMLAGGRAIWGFVNSLPLRYRGEITRLLMRVNRVLGAYLKGQFLLIVIMSTAAFVVLSVLGVRYALILALMTGVLELIPFVGPYLAITICSLVAYFQPHGPGKSFGLDGLTLVILVAVLLFILRQLEDYLVIPNLIGHIVELAPLVIIFTIVTASALLGPMGLLLGVPAVAVIKIITGYIYYKLVDADRQKLIMPPEAGFDELYAALAAQPPFTRLLVVAGSPAPYLHDPDRLHRLSQEIPLDLAFHCDPDTTEGEQAARRLRQAGFPVVTMEKEHFWSDNAAPA